MPAEEASDSGAAEVFGAFIDKLVDQQETSKDSIEKRGISIITTSGALVTLLFALVALFTKSTTYTFPDGAKTWLSLALVLFVLSSVLALLTNMPRTYKGVDPSDFKSSIGAGWDVTKAEALEKVAYTQVGRYETAQKVNTAKGRLLAGAMVFEVAAVVALAAGLHQVITS